VISGLGENQIDLKDLTFTSGHMTVSTSPANGDTTLVVSNTSTNQSVTFTLAGDYTHSTWDFAKDSSGTGTIFHDPPATDVATVPGSASADLAHTVTAALTMQNGASDQFTFQGVSHSGTLASPSSLTVSGGNPSATDAATSDMTSSSSSDHQPIVAPTTDGSAHTGVTSNIATNSQPATSDSTSNGTQPGPTTSTVSGGDPSATDAATSDTTSSSSSDHQPTATATTDGSAHTSLASNAATTSHPTIGDSTSNGAQPGTMTPTASASTGGTGANGADTFVFAANFGNTTVTNFHPDTDVIQIDHTVFADFQALLAAAHNDGNGNAVVTADAHDSITIKNVTVAQFVQHQGDFHFT
jgi:hypothetical protein